jgi:hypothetical protein
MITYSINAHPVIALMFSQTGTDVLPQRDEGSDKPSATIEPHRIMVPTRTRMLNVMPITLKDSLINANNIKLTLI